MSLQMVHRRTRRAATLALIALAPLVACNAAVADGETITSEKQSFRIESVAGGLDHPWGMAFLPDGGILLTERSGRLRVVRNGRLQPEPIAGAPEVADSGQGGLLDVALHPEFSGNGLVYLSYAGAGPGGTGTEVVRGRLVDDRLVGLETVFAVARKSSGGRHFGSRLVFGADGMLYITSGDRGSPDRAQDLDDHAGKILRLTPEGQVPADNPFVGRSDVRPEIYSSGHRNPQGMALQPGSGRIWAVEHGPRGGDELNLIEAGANYGWPVITYGRSYAGFRIGDTKKPGMMQPATWWVPSISPSGLAFYSGDVFAAWRGSLFLGALSGYDLVRLELDGNKVVHEERLLGDFDERIRDVRQGPDGYIYLLTDSSDGGLFRLVP